MYDFGARGTIQPTTTDKKNELSEDVKENSCKLSDERDVSDI